VTERLHYRNSESCKQYAEIRQISFNYDRRQSW